MEISFCDPRLCRVFNSFHLLSDRYGTDAAQSISIRMGVLMAAPRLAAVPTKPPVNLKQDEGTFTVNLVNAQRLRFQPAASAGGVRPLDPLVISEIEIVGVEG